MLSADVAGVVTAVDAEPGQVVAAGAPVLRIAADGVRDVVFSVPEDRVGAVQVGAPARLRAWSQTGELTGRVREVAASSDPVTRTYAVKVSVDAAQSPPPLGATVYVTLPGTGTQGVPVIKLPTTALRQEGGATAVWVLEPASMTLRSQVIEVATADGNEIVVAAGLQPGMQVVSAGVHVLSAGQKVSLYQAKTPLDQSIRAHNAINSIATSAPQPAASSAPAATPDAAPASAASGTK